jgi:hypothetical protein
MAEGAAQIPTFKLVLVGDGGTGKVRLADLSDMLLLVLLEDMRSPPVHQRWRITHTDLLLTAR